jgi:long-chain acyl-CoA synthetase
MPLFDHLRRASQTAPNQIALVATDRTWTYQEFHDTALKLAAALASLGVRRGDRVALQLTNCPELIFSYYACFELGAICVPLNYRFAPPELEYALDHSESRVCIAQADLYRSLDAIRPRLTSLAHVFLVDGANGFTGTREFSELLQSPQGEPFPIVPDDAVAVILYTSGTTSRPKGVTHTHRNLNATAELHGRHIGLSSDDIICVIPPLCHILGFALQLIAGVWARVRLVILSQPDPERILRAVAEHRATRIAALPTMHQALVNHPAAKNYSLQSLRTCLGGGDAVPLALQDQFQATFGVTLLEGCGMTEVIPFTLNTPEQYRPGSIGRACPGVEIRLVDEAGRDVPVGAVGEILVRSDGAMIGYWNEPELTAATLADGFVHTGDLARVDEDGYYWFSGRKKEIIIRAGSNISPLEVEDVLYQHPAVRECGVVGVPDAQFGEVVWAYVATRQPVAADALQEFAGRSLAPYKVPCEIRFLAELPKGPTGKVHRRTLRDWAIRERTEPTQVGSPANEASSSGASATAAPNVISL